MSQRAPARGAAAAAAAAIAAAARPAAKSAAAATTTAAGSKKKAPASKPKKAKAAVEKPRSFPALVVGAGGGCGWARKEDASSSETAGEQQREGLAGGAESAVDAVS
ncbi:unnamed protein product, partial [Scytosiphon promiscuus]